LFVGKVLKEKSVERILLTFIPIDYIIENTS